MPNRKYYINHDLKIRECSTCHEVKEFKSFGMNRGYPRTLCRDCENKTQKAARIVRKYNKDKPRTMRLTKAPIVKVFERIKYDDKCKDVIEVIIEGQLYRRAVWRKKQPGISKTAAKSELLDSIKLEYKLRLHE